MCTRGSGGCGGCGICPGIQEIGNHFALDLYRHRAAAPVQSLSGGNADPALADAVFLDGGAFFAVETDADSTREQIRIMEGALGIDRQAVGKRLIPRLSWVRCGAMKDDDMLRDCVFVCPKTVLSAAWRTGFSSRQAVLHPRCSAP